MRNVLIYYSVILVPLCLLVVAAQLQWINSNEFVFLLALYFLVRQFTDAGRLVAVDAIDKITWKVIANPMLQLQYFKELYGLKG